MRDFGVRLRAQDMPHFRLAARVVMLPCVSVVRVNLHRKVIGGKQEFYQERHGIRGRKPDFSDICGAPDSDTTAPFRGEPQTFS